MSISEGSVIINKAEVGPYFSKIHTVAIPKIEFFRAPNWLDVY